MSKTPTNPSKFTHMAREDECIISPVCEYKVFSNLDVPDNATFVILVPMFVNDISTYHETKMKVRYQPDDNMDPQTARNLNPGEMPEHGVTYRRIDGGAEIYTTHFTKFIVTGEGVNCWNRRLMRKVAVLIYSGLDTTDSEPVANIRLYLCGLHYNIEAYKQVQCSV